MPDEPRIDVLVADDEAPLRSLLEHHLRQANYEVDAVADGLSALEAAQERSYDVAVLDILMPGMDGIEVLRRLSEEEERPEVIVVTGHGTVETALAAMKLGAYDYVTKPYRAPEIALLVRKAWEKKRLHRDNRRLQARVSRETEFPEIVTEDDRMLELIELSAKVAPSESSVLITGESGTGKELVAQAIHRLSGRSESSMIAVNCAALPESLLESELFGHEKGAFTGASGQKLGLFELADGGTLFMDEIGDLDPKLQGKLLRAMEEKVFYRVGGTKKLRSDVRLVAATNQPLEEMVESGEFRRDLFYRVNTITIDLPPLQDRDGDVPLLARHFLKTLPGGGEGWSLDEEAEGLLAAYDWPGNVRELRNVMERALLLARDRTVTPRDLPLDIQEEGGGDDASGSVPGTTTSDGRLLLDPDDNDISLEAMEKRHIAAVLDHTGWHQGQAAELLGISPKTLYRKIRQYGFERPE